MSDMVEMFRDLRDLRKARRAENAVAGLAHVEDAEAMGCTVETLNHGTCYRIKAPGGFTCDYWPSSDKWMPVGSSGKARRGGADMVADIRARLCAASMPPQ